MERNNDRRPQHTDCYYGTGRRPETEKSQLPLILSLLSLLLAANLITIAVHLDLDGTTADASEPSASESSSYPLHYAVQPAAARTGFGMELSELDDAERRYWDLPGGVIVRTVEGGGAAERAGILPGDVILAVQGETVAAPADVLAAEGSGETITLTVYRRGRRFDVVLTAAQPPTS